MCCRLLIFLFFIIIEKGSPGEVAEESSDLILATTSTP